MTERERALAALAALAPGVNRPSWVRIAMASKAAGVSLEEFDAWSSTAPNYSGPADTRAVWSSISIEGGIGPGTLFKLASDAGWQGSRRSVAATTSRRSVAYGSRVAPITSPEAIWEASAAATAEHPYVARKRGMAAGLRVYGGAFRVAGIAVDGCLVCPAYGPDGALRSLQFIPGEAGAKKLNFPGRPLSGWFKVGGDLRDGEVCYVVEGLGAAWSAHMASRKPAVVTFGAGRFDEVARGLKARWPAMKLVFVADRGKEPQAQALSVQYEGMWVEMPADSPNNYDINDLHCDRGLTAVSDLLSSAKAPAERFQLLTADQLAARPPLRWRIRGILPETGIAALFGASGSGKSFLLVDMLGAIAEGREWFGHRVAVCSVTIVCLEGQAGVGVRLRAYSNRFGTVPAQMRFIAQPFELMNDADLHELARAISTAGGDAGIVAIDTLNAAVPGLDENSSADMSLVIRGAKTLQQALGGVVLLVHHSGKDPTKGMRGHSSLHAAMDTIIEVSRNGARREWTLTKAKDETDGASHPFKLEVVDVGIDDEGGRFASCVVAAEAASEVSTHAVARPKGVNQVTAWDKLGPVFRASRDFGKAGAPSGRPCITTEGAIEAVASALVCEPKRRRERAATAIQGLVGAGLLTHNEGWLWCV